MTPKAALGVFQDAFGATGGVLDPSLGALPNFGIYRGDVIADVLRDHLHVQLKSLKREVRIVVCDLWTRQPVLVTRRSHPDVWLDQAVRCSISIPGFFAASRLEANNARLYVDGGCARNFAMDAADDLPGKTVGIRVEGKADAEIRPVRPWDYRSYFAAMASLFLYASDHGYGSAKADSAILRIQTDEDGLDFTLSKYQCQARYDEGYREGIKWARDP
jgi:predicted acylesterase/phospholipase RssA